MKATRLFDLLDQYTELYSEKDDAFGAKVDGEWIKYSSKDYVHHAYTLSYGLLSMGLKPGDKIATVSNNRPEWNFMDMAMNMSGIIHVPVYPTISEDDFEYVLNHAEPKLLLVSDQALFNKLQPIAERVSSIKDVYTFNDLEGAKNWKAIYEKGVQNESKFKDQLLKIRDSIKSEDLATIIYTSGTTGNPKGVMLSHKNILGNIKGIMQVFNLNHTQRTLSFLPISHIFERTINYYFQQIGLSVYYAENLGAIGNNIKEIKPHVLIAVPRVLERIYDRIIGRGKDLKGIKRQLFFWAVNLGLTL
jgi:long-chain acyl-CoA synthetase